MSKWIIEALGDNGEWHDIVSFDRRLKAEIFQDREHEKRLKQFHICRECSSDSPLCDNQKWDEKGTIWEDCENAMRIWDIYPIWHIRKD